MFGGSRWEDGHLLDVAGTDSCGRSLRGTNAQKSEMRAPEKIEETNRFAGRVFAGSVGCAISREKFYLSFSGMLAQRHFFVRNSQLEGDVIAAHAFFGRGGYCFVESRAEAQDAGGDGKAFFLVGLEQRIRGAF